MRILGIKVQFIISGYQTTRYLRLTMFVRVMFKFSEIWEFWYFFGLRLNNTAPFARTIVKFIPVFFFPLVYNHSRIHRYLVFVTHPDKYLNDNTVRAIFESDLLPINLSSNGGVVNVYKDVCMWGGVDHLRDGKKLKILGRIFRLRKQLELTETGVAQFTTNRNV